MSLAADTWLWGDPDHFSAVGSWGQVQWPHLWPLLAGQHYEQWGGGEGWLWKEIPTVQKGVLSLTLDIKTFPPLFLRMRMVCCG